jgi:hypothetical protein
MLIQHCQWLLMMMRDIEDISGNLDDSVSGAHGWSLSISRQCGNDKSLNERPARLGMPGWKSRRSRGDAHSGVIHRCERRLGSTTREWRYIARAVSVIDHVRISQVPRKLQSADSNWAGTEESGTVGSTSANIGDVSGRSRLVIG